jgi:hypothetical protein
MIIIYDQYYNLLLLYKVNCITCALCPALLYTLTIYWRHYNNVSLMSFIYILYLTMCIWYIIFYLILHIYYIFYAAEILMFLMWWYKLLFIIFLIFLYKKSTCYSIFFIIIVWKKKKSLLCCERMLLLGSTCFEIVFYCYLSFNS